MCNNYMEAKESNESNRFPTSNYISEERTNEGTNEHTKKRNNERKNEREGNKCHMIEKLKICLGEGKEANIRAHSIRVHLATSRFID